MPNTIRMDVPLHLRGQVEELLGKVLTPGSVKIVSVPQYVFEGDDPSAKETRLVRGPNGVVVTAYFQYALKDPSGETWWVFKVDDEMIACKPAFEVWKSNVSQSTTS